LTKKQIAANKRKAPEVDWRAIEDPAERRRQRRLAKNRVTAARSRERKKEQWGDMENQLADLRAENLQMKAMMEAMMRENTILKDQLASLTRGASLTGTGSGPEPAVLRCLAIMHLVCHPPCVKWVRTVGDNSFSLRLRAWHLSASSVVLGWPYCFLDSSCGNGISQQSKLAAAGFMTRGHKQGCIKAVVHNVNNVPEPWLQHLTSDIVDVDGDMEGVHKNGIGHAVLAVYMLSGWSLSRGGGWAMECLLLNCLGIVLAGVFADNFGMADFFTEFFLLGVLVTGLVLLKFRR
jgi:hypothetical protein